MCNTRPPADVCEWGRERLSSKSQTWGECFMNRRKPAFAIAALFYLSPFGVRKHDVPLLAAPQFRSPFKMLGMLAIDDAVAVC